MSMHFTPETPDIRTQLHESSASSQVLLAEFFSEANFPASTRLASQKHEQSDVELERAKAEKAKADEALKSRDYPMAEAALKDAIEAADKIDYTPFKVLLDQNTRELSNVPAGQKERELIEQRHVLEQKIDMPVDLRLELAKFYLDRKNPTAAKNLLENKDFLSRFPEATKRVDYKLIHDFAVQYSRK